jgi:hypothetical protein
MSIKSLSFSRERLQNCASPGCEVSRSVRRSRALPVSQARAALDFEHADSFLANAWSGLCEGPNQPAQAAKFGRARRHKDPLSDLFKAGLSKWAATAPPLRRAGIDPRRNCRQRVPNMRQEGERPQLVEGRLLW